MAPQDIVLNETYDLQLDSFTIEFNSTDLEVNTNRGDEGGGPSVVTETQQET